MTSAGMIDSANGYGITIGKKSLSHEEQKRFMKQSFGIDIDDPEVAKYSVNKATDTPLAYHEEIGNINRAKTTSVSARATCKQRSYKQISKKKNKRTQQGNNISLRVEDMF